MAPSKIRDQVLNLDYVDNRRTDHAVENDSPQRSKDLSEPQIVINTTSTKKESTLIQKINGRFEGVFSTSDSQQYQMQMMETQTSSAKRYTLMQLKQMTKAKMTEKDL